MNQGRGFLAWADLDFTTELRDKTLDGTDLAALKAEYVETIGAMGEVQRKSYLEMARRWYAEQEATRNSVTSRASTLMLFVGVITTGTTLVAANVTIASDWIRLSMLAVGGVLLYACLAIAFGAVRAQGVKRLTVPFLTPSAASAAGKTLEVEEAAEYATALEQNKKILANLVACLGFAHKWALRALILVALLAVLTVLAASTKPSSSGNSAGAVAPSPAPTALSSSSSPPPSP